MQSISNSTSLRNYSKSNELAKLLNDARESPKHEPFQFEPPVLIQEPYTVRILCTNLDLDIDEYSLFLKSLRDLSNATFHSLEKVACPFIRNKYYLRFIGEFKSKTDFFTFLLQFNGASEVPAKLIKFVAILDETQVKEYQDYTIENRIYVQGISIESCHGQAIKLLENFGSISYADLDTVKRKGISGIVQYHEKEFAKMAVNWLHKSRIHGDKISAFSYKNLLDRIKTNLPNYMVTISNIDPELTKEELKEYFSTFGQLKSFNYDPISRTAQLSFTTKMEASQCSIIASGKRLGDSQLKVEFDPVPQDLKLYIHQIPSNTSFHELKSLLDQYGTLSTLHIPEQGTLKDQNRIWKGPFGVAEFKTTQETMTAYRKLNDTIFKQQRLHLSLDSRANKQKQIYIGKLPMEYTIDHVQDMFDECGEITKVRLWNHSYKQGKRAIIQFHQVTSVAKALSLYHNKIFSSICNLVVKRSL